MIPCRLRGEVCIGLATIFSFTAFILLIFVHVGQINTSSVSRGIAMVKVDVSQYGQTLAQVLNEPINGLYATNASAPLQKGAGIRQVYKYGLYSYCGYFGDTAGTCSNTAMGNKYLPYNNIIADMSSNYSALTASIINGKSPFASQSLGTHTRTASYLILIGTVFAFLTFVISVYTLPMAFFASTCLAILATTFIVAAAARWTSAIHTSQSVNKLIRDTTNTFLGIEVSSGSGLSMLWTAAGLLIASLLPHLISCCTYRG